MNVLEKYIKENAGRTDIYETRQLGTQCVALVKHYSVNVVDIRLGTFGGSAKTGWENKSNTFPSSLWTRHINKYGDVSQVPNIGDIVFFKTNTPYDHVAVVRKATGNTIEVFEQNTGNGDGVGYDDRARINTYGYENCYGWYSPVNFYIEYRGVPVNFIEQPKNRPTLLGYYGVNTKSINITPRGREKEDFEMLMEHEWSHYIYWDKMTKDHTELWERVSQFDSSTRSWVSKYIPGKYFYNKYISAGETNESEDFAETWEDICRNPDIVYGDYRDFKRTVVQALIDKYGDL